VLFVLRMVVDRERMTGRVHSLLMAAIWAPKDGKAGRGQKDACTCATDGALLYSERVCHECVSFPARRTIVRSSSISPRSNEHSWASRRMRTALPEIEIVTESTLSRT
jgi:hypothetical protein